MRLSFQALLLALALATTATPTALAVTHRGEVVQVEAAPKLADHLKKLLGDIRYIIADHLKWVIVDNGNG